MYHGPDFDLANQLSPDRAQSLAYRFKNEDALLAKAWKRKWFGWGRYGRNKVYSDNPFAERSDSVTDGYCDRHARRVGDHRFRGRFRFAGALRLPAAGALKYARSKQDRILLGSLSLIVAIYMANLVPNTAIYSWTWLLVGGLLGYAEAVVAAARERVPGKNVQLTPVPLGSPTRASIASRR